MRGRKANFNSLINRYRIVGTNKGRKSRSTEVVSDVLGLKPERLIVVRTKVITPPLDEGVLHLQSNRFTMVSDEDES